MILRDYQKTAVNKVIDSILGQTILPTGTGKSVIQSVIIEVLIGKDGGKFGVYCILTPRILLTNQLMGVAVSHLRGRGIDLMTHTIHSGDPAKLIRPDDDAEYKNWAQQLINDTTTGYRECTEAIERARREDRPLLICSTYHSCGVLAKALEDSDTCADQILCDEAHYILQEDFYKSIERLKISTVRIHFFTATQKVTDGDELGGRGMKNISFYGEVVYRQTPNEMIKAGFMVRPRIHYERCESTAKWADMVWDAFEHHSTQLTEQQKPKLLVCCDGSKTIQEICTSEFMNSCKSNNIRLFDISSAFGPRIDGESVGRGDFLEELREHKGKAIVLHINILTEGIDVPDMSGVMFIRNMEMSRLLQSIGRSTRPDPRDLDSDYMPLYSASEIEKLVKPYAWAIIAERDGVNEKANIEVIIRNMRRAGFLAEETVILAYDKGANTPVVFDPTKKSKETKIWSELFGPIFHDIEEKEYVESLIGMSTEELMRF
jgi:superfamily II DNA or RNA helicase